MAREVRVGERFRIVRIDDDPDAYAVIQYAGGYAFGCGRAWFERNRPVVGAFVAMGSDGHWYVDKDESHV